MTPVSQIHAEVICNMPVQKQNSFLNVDFNWCLIPKVLHFRTVIIRLKCQISLAHFNFLFCSYKLKPLQTDGYDELVWWWKTEVSDHVSNKGGDLKAVFLRAKCSNQQVFVSNRTEHMCSQSSSCFVPGLTQNPCNVRGTLSQAVQQTVWKCCWALEQHWSFTHDSWQKYKKPQIQAPLWLMIRLKFLYKSCLKSKPRRNLKYLIEGTSVTVACFVLFCSDLHFVLSDTSNILSYSVFSHVNKRNSYLKAVSQLCGRMTKNFKKGNNSLRKSIFNAWTL